MHRLVPDLRSAARYLTRRPLVTLVGVAMLSLGIGAATAMFTVVDTVLLQGPPYPAAGRLVSIWETFPHWRGRPVLDGMWDRIALSYSEYESVAALNERFEGVAAACWRPEARLTGIGDPAEVSVARGSATLLPLLGARMELGRWFLPGEQGPAAPRVAVLPYTLWTSRFGRDPHVLGRTIDLDDTVFIVIGVLPMDFAFTSLSPFAREADRTAIWTPMGAWSGDLVEHSQNFEVIARLRPGVAMEPTRADVARVIRGDRDPTQHDARLLGRQEAETGGVKAPLVALFAAVAILLAITCANLAALLLGEAAGREAEVRTRMALGATVRRVVTQLLTESALLALLGAALGIPLAIGLTKAMLALAPVGLPRAQSITLGWRALVFSLGAAVAASVAFGVTPALSLGRLGHQTHAGGNRSVTGRRRIQHGLIAIQIGLSMVLLVGAGLLTRTLAVQAEVPPGFDARNLLTVSVNASLHSQDPADRGEAQRFYDAVLAAIGGLPSVVTVTATSNIPIAGRGGQWAISPDPAVKLSLASPNAQHDEVLPGYFVTMRIPMLAGRALSDDDRAGAPLVAVVNETMARQFWPREAAIGRPFLAPNGGVRTVVGIVADIREQGLGREPVPTFYESVRQLPTSRQTLLVRTRGDPLALGPAVRHAIWSVDPALPIESISTMDAIVYESLAPQRYRVLLMSFFAIIATAMTAVGVGGVALRAVSSQMRELCIRMAIGARPGQVIALVVTRYARLAVMGLLGGAAAAAAAARLIETYLVNVPPRDVATYSVASLLLLAIVVLAGWLPARRLRRARLAEHLARVS
jgi:putative ABC transport system permease protein